MNETNLKAWEYFLDFTGENLASTKKQCLVVKTKKQGCPMRFEGNQKITVLAHEIEAKALVYMMFNNEKNEPELIAILRSIQEVEAEPDYMVEGVHDGIIYECEINLVADVKAFIDKEEMKRLIQVGRDFMKADMKSEFASDQMMKKTQPPLYKEAYGDIIPLNRDFSQLTIEKDFLKIINKRKSHRNYTKEAITLDELSYLLWCTQGVKEIVGDGYATIRTVPCGGARHEFETYCSIHNVVGLKQGVYHYLSGEHALELLHEEENIEEKCANLLCGQSFAKESALTFMWSCVCYRAEWRYNINAHRIILQDIGHVGENLYLACESIGLGTCGVGAYLQEEIDEFCGLDGNEEFIVYSAPVGKVLNENKG